MLLKSLFGKKTQKRRSSKRKISRFGALYSRFLRTEALEQRCLLSIQPTLSVIGDQFAQTGQPLALANIGTFTHEAVPSDFKYQVDWGDGSDFDTGEPNIISPGSEETPLVGSFGSQHIYYESGEYYVAASVIAGGATDTRTFLVTVTGENIEPPVVFDTNAIQSVPEQSQIAPPVLSIVSDQSTRTGQLLDLPEIGTFSHSFVTDDFTFQIDWGDGNFDTGTATIISQDTDTLAGTFDGRHTYYENGNYYAAVSVTDPVGNTATKTLLVSVTGESISLPIETPQDTNLVLPDPTDQQAEGAIIQPALSVTVDQAAYPGQTLTLPELATFTHISMPGNFFHTIDWGDGSSADTGTATITSPGSATALLQGSIGGSHIYYDLGEHSVSVSVTNPIGNVDTKTFHVTVFGPSVDSTHYDTAVVTDTSEDLTPLDENPPQALFTIPSGTDPAVLAAIHEALAIPTDIELTDEDMARLTTLTLDSNKVYSLTNLDYATNLETLTIVPGDASKSGHLTGTDPLLPLRSLPNLKNLTLQGCALTDGSFASFSGSYFAALESLDLRYNSISVIPAGIGTRTNLKMLYVYGNPLTDNPRAGLVNLSGKLLNVDLPADHPEKALTMIDLYNPSFDPKAVGGVYQELAAAFYNLPLKIYEWVLNTIEYQPYPGAMKGPLATLMTKAGNDWDTNTLLKELFAKAGITDLQYATVEILEDKDTVLKWLGATNPKGAYDILDYAGVAPGLYKRVGETWVWLDPTIQSEWEQTEYIKFYHSWLHRDVGGGLPAMYLDATWKLRDFQPGISNIATNVPFVDNDYFSLDPDINKETTYEFYEDQVRTYLATYDWTHTIADAAYDGPIHPQSIIALPQGYLYDFSSGTIVEHPSLTDFDTYLHKLRISVNIPQSGTLTVTPHGDDTITLVASSNIFTSAMNGGAVILDDAPGGKKAFAIITNITSNTNTVMVRGTITPTTPFTSSFALPGFTYLDETADLALKRITVGNTDTGEAPRLYIDGQQTSQSTFTVPDGIYYVVLERTHGNGPVTSPEPSPSDNLLYFQLNAGQYTAIGMDVAQFSQQSLVEIRSDVNDAEINMANGATPTADQLIGGLLHLGLATYYEELLRSDEVVAGLTWATNVHISSGLGIAKASVDDVADPGLKNANAPGDDRNVQFPYMPENFGFDLPQSIVMGIAIDGGMTYTQQRARLMGYTLSSLEATVWEELTNMPAVSTMKAFQTAKQDGTNSFHTFSYGDSEATIAAFLEIVNPPSDPNREATIAHSIWSFTQQHYNVEVHKKEILIGDDPDPAKKWKGVGYVCRKDEGTYDAGYFYIIQGGIGDTLEAPHGSYAMYPPNFVYEAPNSLNSPLALSLDPINVANGEVVHDETDISVPNLGVPMDFARHYHSFYTEYDRGIGAGWSFSFSDRLEFGTVPGRPNDVVWFTDIGVRLTFEYNSGTYTTPDTIFGTFQHLGGGAGYQWNDKNGNTVKWDESGRLTRILDRFQDGVEVSYTTGTQINKVRRVLDNVVAATECSLTFTYSGGHIVSILAKATPSDEGRTWTYTYNGTGQLTSVTAPSDTVTPYSRVSYEYYLDGDVREDLLKKVTDQLGNTTQYTYYANRRGYRVTDSNGNQQNLTYNLFRNRSASTNELYQTTYSFYDSDGNLTKEFYPDQTTVSYAWNSKGLMTEEADAFGQKNLYEYDLNTGKVTRFEDRDHKVTLYTYSTSTTLVNLLTETRQSDMRVTKYQYANPTNGAENNDGACLWKVTQDFGGTVDYVTLYEYAWGTSNRGFVTAMTTPNGTYTTGDTNDYKTTYTYNTANGLMLTRSTRYGSGGGESILETFVYDTTTPDTQGRGYLTSYTDGNNYTTTYTNDILGRRRTETLPDPDSTSSGLPAPGTGYTYDAAGNVIAVNSTAPQQSTRMVYDKMERPIKVTNIDGTYRIIRYDAAGNVVAETDELGRVTQYFYDSRNRRIAAIRPDGTVISTDYNGGGLVVSATDANGNMTKYEYDKLGRKTREIKPDVGLGEAITKFYYDAQGNLQYVTDPLGASYTDTTHTTTYTYNKLGWKLTETLPDPDGTGPTHQLARPVTTWTYDRNGNVQTIVDPRGHTTTYTYDEKDRNIMQQESDPLGGSAHLYTWFYYDKNDNLQYVVNAAGATSSRPANWSASYVNYTTEYVYDHVNRKTKEIQPDPDGAGGASRPEIRYDYNKDGNLEKVTDPLLNVTKFVYDKLNRRTKVIDALGTTVTITANGVTKNADGHTTTTMYDAVGNVIAVTDGLGRTTFYQYDAMNRKIQQTLPRPNAAEIAPRTAWLYDYNGNLVAAMDARDNVTWVQYNAWNLPVATTDAFGAYIGDPQHSIFTAYDLLGRVTAVTDQLGRTTSYVYDNLGRKIQETAPDPDDYTGQNGTNGSQSAAVTYYGYDANGNLKYITDPRGGAKLNSTYTTYYFYDLLNRPICTIDALGVDYTYDWTVPSTPPTYAAGDHSTRTTYDKLGNVTSTQDQMGRVTNYEYDNLSRKKKTIEPDPDGIGGVGRSETTFVYDANGNMTSTTDPLGHTTYYKFDALNRQIRTVDARGTSIDDTHFATSTTYDAVGNVLSQTDPDHNITSYQYDRLNRLVKDTDPLGNTKRYKYDPNGNLVQKTDALKRVTEYVFDELNRKVEEDWLDSNKTIIRSIQTHYDAASQILSVTDPDSSYEYNYDRAGHTIRSRMAPGDLEQPDMTQVSGNVSNPSNYYIVNPSPTAVRTGEVIRVVIVATGFNPKLKVVRPNLTEIIVSATSTTLSVDITANDPLHEGTGTWQIYVGSADGVHGGSYTVYWQVDPVVPNPLTELNYSYDAAGNILQIADDWGITTNYEYDPLSRMTEEVQAGTAPAKHVDYAYNDASQPLTITRYAAATETNWVATTYYQKLDYTSGYDGMGRLTHMWHNFNGYNFLYTYQYDLASRITYVSMPLDTVDFTGGYDALNQLKSANYGTRQADESYSYDANGNKTNKDGTAWKTSVGNRVLFDGTYTYKYDKEGNRSVRFVDQNHNNIFDAGDTNVTFYGWDYRNRLAQVIWATGYNGTWLQQLYYTYDWQDRQIARIKDQYPADGYMDEYRYNVYQGVDPVMEIYDKDGLANNGYAGSISHIYLYGPGQDQIVAVDSSSGTLWGLADQEGTIRDVLQLNAPDNYNWWHRDYDSFGKVVYDDGPDYLFGKDGMAIDPDAYLYRTDARLYDPLTSYWITVDPSGFSSNDPNLYRFCGNDPYNRNDSSGKRWTDTVGTSLTTSSLVNIFSSTNQIGGRIVMNDPTPAFSPSGQPQQVQYQAMVVPYQQSSMVQGPTNGVQMFGETFVSPFSENAGGVLDTLGAYGRATYRTASTMIYGAAGGAATGTLTGMATGAVVGGVPSGGIGALPGAGVGGAAGLVGGSIIGGLEGFSQAYNMRPGDSLQVAQGNSAMNSMVMGVPQGVMGGAFSVLATPPTSFSVTTNTAKTITTPYAVESQSMSASAQAALVDARTGATLYRTGQLGQSMAGESQYWALQNPLTPGYTNQMGMPGVNPNFIMGGTLNPGASIITNQAAGLGANAGGGIQVITSPGGVSIQWFHMP